MNNSIRLYNTAVISVQNYITTFKNTLNQEKISEQIQELENNSLTENLKLKRSGLNNVCQRYSSLVQDRDEIINRVASLNENLQRTQTEYLDLYFTKINDFFSRLGSGNFTIRTSQAEEEICQLFS